MEGEATVERPPVVTWVAVLGGMGLLGALCLSSSAYALWAEHVTGALSQGLLRWIFGLAIAAHVAEAIAAYRLARRLGDRGSASAWFWQTLMLGYFSLGLLRRRARDRASATT